MEKLVRDGKVAILYSKGYGAGWYSWHGIKELIFHPKLIEMVELGNRDLGFKQKTPRNNNPHLTT